MTASYVEGNHKTWDKYLPEFHFAINSSVHESTGVTPAEINISRPLKGPMDMELSPRLCTPDSPAYHKACELADLGEVVAETINEAKTQQKLNYDRKRREQSYLEKDRVWLKTHPFSMQDQSFSKFAPQRKGPYRVMRKLGLLNYEILLEDSGEDLPVAHVAQLKTCYPTAADWNKRQRQRLIEKFAEESEDEDFTGF